jgi:hypothetical protein
MKTALLLLLLAATVHAAVPPIVFDKQPIHPEAGIPEEATRQSKVDPQDHGTLAQVLGDSVQSVTVRYYSDVWKDPKQVGEYLTGLLANDDTHTYTFQIWSQGVDVPEIECALTFKNQKQGRLLLWQTAACVCDSNGKWWFVNLYDYFHSKNPKGVRSYAKKTPSEP